MQAWAASRLHTAPVGAGVHEGAANQIHKGRSVLANLVGREDGFGLWQFCSGSGRIADGTTIEIISTIAGDNKFNVPTYRFFACGPMSYRNGFALLHPSLRIDRLSLGLLVCRGRIHRRFNGTRRRSRQSRDIEQPGLPHPFSQGPLETPKARVPEGSSLLISRLR